MSCSFLFIDKYIVFFVTFLSRVVKTGSIYTTTNAESLEAQLAFLFCRQTKRFHSVLTVFFSAATHKNMLCECHRYTFATFSHHVPQLGHLFPCPRPRTFTKRCIQKRLSAHIYNTVGLHLGRLKRDKSGRHKFALNGLLVFLPLQRSREMVNMLKDAVHLWCQISCFTFDR